MCDVDYRSIFVYPCNVFVLADGACF